jgi:tRNA G18 (ribose-2'-O)-methylase SpoU
MSAPAPTPTEQGRVPELRCVVRAVHSQANLGNLLRSSVALGCVEVLIIGATVLRQTFGSQGAHKRIRPRFFRTLSEARDYLHSIGSELVAIEISDDAVSINTDPWRGDTAIIVGNETRGIPPDELAMCDRVVYIPQYGCAMASLNVYVAASIAMHRFQTWAGHPERARSGAKYIEDPLPTPEEERNSDHAKEVARKRAAEHAQARIDANEPPAFDPFAEDEPL